MALLRRGLAERLRLIVPEALSRSGRCQRHGLEYSIRTGVENLQVLTGECRSHSVVVIVRSQFLYRMPVFLGERNLAIAMHEP